MGRWGLGRGLRLRDRRCRRLFDGGRTRMRFGSSLLLGLEGGGRGGLGGWFSFLVVVVVVVVVVW